MSDILRLESVRGKVDFAVITIRKDEYEAVLDRFPNRKVIVGGEWLYEHTTLNNRHGEEIRVVVARTKQGHGAAQQTANNIVDDLNPKWIVLVGIAGGFPTDDFSLGDVVLASSLVDFSVTAAVQGGGTEYTSGGGPFHHDVERLLSWLPSQKHSLCEWNVTQNLIQEKPTLVVPSGDDDRLYGDPEYKKKVYNSLRLHFATYRDPLFTPATLATSNTLVKDTAIVKEFKDVARDVEHVEMEAGGVYRVCHQHKTPLLCIRGISDVVGFKRGPEWTQFACHSAASFFHAILDSLSKETWGPSLANSGDNSNGVRPPVFPKTDNSKAAQIVEISSTTDLRARIGQLSSLLFQYELPEENRIDFDVEKGICQLSNEHKVKLLLGPPGSGKTCLLAKIANKFMNEGLAVLAVKADMFPHDKTFDEWAQRELCQDLSFLEVVQAVAAREKVVVVVDQLDALASTVDLTSGRLNELLAFIANCKVLPNVHIISSCRNFDFSYDPRFHRLAAQTHQLELPSWEQTAGQLQKHGIDSEQIQPKFQELLRTPQHLTIFLKLQGISNTSDSKEIKTFKTYHEMLGEFWDFNVTEVGEIKFIIEFSKRLVDTESIWAPIATLQCNDQLISSLCSKGLVERNNNQLRFSHQTIQEYAVARLFAESDISLTEFVLKHQETIFQRPTIWAVLNYLRTNATDKYFKEIQTILNNNPRIHVTFLLIDFICHMHKPTSHEIALIGWLLDDEETRLRILVGINSQEEWFNVLKQTHFPSIMRNPDTELWPMVSILTNSWKFDWNSTFELVRDCWGKDERFDLMTLRVMEHCGKWNDDILMLLERVMIRVKYNHGRHHQIEQLVGIISVEHPQAAARLAAKVIATALKEHPDSKSQRNSPLEQTDGWYNLEEIAKAAPFVFLVEIIPWLILTANKFHDGYVGSVLNRYIGSCMALDDIDYPSEPPVLMAIQSCIELSSKDDAPEFVRLCRSCWDSENAVVHRIFINGLMNVVGKCPDDVLEYLLGDNRRFTVGEYGDTQDSQSTKLIELLIPHLQDHQRDQLIERIMQWTKYKPQAELCEDQIVWDRESRLHLLTAIPTMFLPSATMQFIEKEKSELPDWDREILRSHGGIVKTIPPITMEEMATVEDEELIDAFSKSEPENPEWNRVEGGFEEQGGAEAAGQELAKLAESNPQRAAEIIRILVSNGVITNINYALQKLTNCPNRAMVFGLVKDVSNACEESEEFRSSASRLVAAHCDENGLPEEIIELLESWLAKPWNHKRSVVVDDDKKEWKPESSFLWSYLGLVTLDTDYSYFTLIALTKSLLSKNNPQGDRWINSLLAHLENQVSYKTWEIFCNDLCFVRAEYCTPELGKELISRLFKKFPELASETFGCRLLARLGGFLDAEFLSGILKQLVSSDDQFKQQAGGELLTLFALLDSTSEWASPLLTAKLLRNEGGSTPDVAFLVGSAHAAANLWHDLNKPSECAKILQELIRSGDTNVGDATRTLYWNEISLPANSDIAALIEAITDRIEIVSGSLAEDVLGQLSDMLPHLRPEILRFCNKLVKKRFDELRRRDFNAYEIGPSLVEISMALQRFDDTRSSALDLFETLLRAGLDEADKALKDVDEVTQLTQQSQPKPRRRRRRRR